MQPIDNPFTEADRLFDEASEPLPPVRLVDFHCEITSEKNAMGLYLDGRVSAVVGTHTHVVTGDERILPGGTAYQTDIGMTGPDLERHRLRAEDRPAPLHQRPADPLRGGVRAGDHERRPGGHRPGDRPGARDRAVPAPPRGMTVRRGDGATRRPGDPVVPPAPSTIDLHTHTARSDGLLEPAALVAAAAAAGVRLLAITDHDTLAGVRERPRRRRRPSRPGAPPGIELNAVVARSARPPRERGPRPRARASTRTTRSLEATLALQRTRRAEPDST